MAYFQFQRACRSCGTKFMPLFGDDPNRDICYDCASGSATKKYSPVAHRSLRDRIDGLLALFRPKWQSNDLSACIAAVQKTTSQEKLGRMVMKGSYFTQDEALKKIIDPKILAGIARKHPNSTFRLWALRKIDDPAVLADAARNDEYERVREEAVGKLYERALLEEIRQKDKGKAVRRAAGKRIEQLGKAQGERTKPAKMSS